MKSRRSISRPLIILLCIGLSVRLLFAYVIFPNAGHLLDIEWYWQWASSLAQAGLGNFYATRLDANYPPAYMYVLWLIGTITQALAAAFDTDVHRLAVWTLKLPPMLLDLGASFLLYCIAQHCCGERAKAERVALTAAALYLFNPVTLDDSAIWGQTDAAGAFVVLLGVFAVLKWPPEISASAAVLAALVKPQFGVIMIPLIGVVLLRRHFVPENNARGFLAKSHWTSGNGPLRILTSIVAAVAVFYVIVVPFNLGFRALLERMGETAGYYKFLSVNAFNPWALVGTQNEPSLIIAGLDNWVPDDVPLVGSITGVAIGTALLIGGFAVGIARLAWRSDWRSIVLVGAYLSLCFFILPTRVHERYVFQTFAFVSILAAFDWRWLWVTVLLAIGSLMNFQAALGVDGSEELVRLPFNGILRSAEGIFISVVLQTAAFLFALWSLRPGAIGSTDSNLISTSDMHRTPNF